MTKIDEVLATYGEITLTEFYCGECELALYIESYYGIPFVLCQGQNGECGRRLEDNGERTLYKKHKVRVHVEDVEQEVKINKKNVHKSEI